MNPGAAGTSYGCTGAITCLKCEVLGKSQPAYAAILTGIRGL
jgi:hypothetical protein